MSHELFHEIVLREVSQNILHTKFISPEICSLILEACLEKDSWSGNKRQSYSTQDIHLKTELPSWYELLKVGLDTALEKASEWWNLGEEISVAEVFALKYSMDTQRVLKVHHDDSFISGSIKLNSGYHGAELFFPRQNFTNKNIPIGDLLLWPGQITHEHGSATLLSGEKYSITIWTKNEDMENYR